MDASRGDWDPWQRACTGCSGRTRTRLGLQNAVDSRPPEPDRFTRLFLSSPQTQTILCFFYAKQVPFVEDSAGGRILIGVGRVLHVGAVQEYDYTTKDLKGKLRSMLWERMIQHSIRTEFTDGFLLPYHAAIDKAVEDPEFDPAEIAAFSPADRLLEFSHASQLVSHDGAIASLLACAESIRKAKDVLPGPWNQCLQWINVRLGELWKARGPCPGLGSALNAFGMQFGTFIARTLAEKAGDNADPWPLVDKMFADPRKHLPEPLAKSIGNTLCSKWSRLPDDRRALIKLVSCFDITPEQATALYVQEERAKIGIDIRDSAILANPYLLYELTRLTAEPVSVWTVDRGVFPDEIIRGEAPAPCADGSRCRNGRSPGLRNFGQNSRRCSWRRQHDSSTGSGGPKNPGARPPTAL